MLCSVLNTSKTFKNVDINSREREREIERHRPDRYFLISRTVLQALTVPKLSSSTEKLSGCVYSKAVSMNNVI